MACSHTGRLRILCPRRRGRGEWLQAWAAAVVEDKQALGAV